MDFKNVLFWSKTRRARQILDQNRTTLIPSYHRWQGKVRKSSHGTVPLSIALALSFFPYKKDYY
jgi:hypothetical protein